MRRLLSGAAKAVHRNRQQRVFKEKDLCSLNLKIGPAPPYGHRCWDNSRCGLCSKFLDPWFVLNMFTSGSASVGKLTDLIAWSQAGRGCTLCKYLICWYFRELGSTIPFDADFIVKWDRKAVHGADHGRRIQFTSIEFGMMWKKEMLLGWGQGIKTEDYQERGADFNCHTESDQEIARYLPTRLLNPYVGSEAAFSQARRWIQICIDSHLQCRQISPGSSELPTRILEVSKNVDGTYSVKLQKGNGRKAPYVALSYVWGGPQTCQTLLCNVDEQMSGIDPTKLPLTIRDAVYCTVELGCKYLWVDSLCIIQDSLVDKALEIDRMSRIYKNSYVTISAANAVRCEQGFLEARIEREDLFRLSFCIDITTPRDPNLLYEWVAKYGLSDGSLDFLMKGEDIFKASSWQDSEKWSKQPSKMWIALTPLDIADHGDLLTAHDIQTEPINKRGWTLQESWLSPRLLIYGTKQMLWRCRAGIQADGGVLGHEDKDDIRDKTRVDQGGQMVHLDGTKVSEEEKHDIFNRIWEDLVTESSIRELGSPADKLNALEGIVQELKQSLGDVYLAGLWKSNLVNQLCWYQDARGSDAESLVWNTKRICPSWSWTKTDGYVSFGAANMSDVIIQDAQITRNEITGKYPDTKLHVQGSIRLKAPVMKVTQSHLSHFKFPAPGETYPHFLNMMHPDGGFTNPEMPLIPINGEQQIEIPADLRFLELTYGRSHDYAPKESRGLMIVPVDEEDQPNMYIRVGFFVVMLEMEIEATGLVLTTGRTNAPSNLRETELGKTWRSSFKEEEIVLV